MLLLAFFYAKNLLLAQEIQFPVNTRIYLVRHAEKESGNDPILTEAGKKRAGDLMRILKNKPVHRIYVTNYRRSVMTTDSMRIQMGIDTVHYVADTTGADLIARIKSNNDYGKTILVIGHSNTVLKLIKALGIKDYGPRDIPDNEFDNLYLVKYKKGKAYLSQQKYGTVSGTSASMKSNQ